MMTITQCQDETLEHIHKVREYLYFIVEELKKRGLEHDRLKMESPEVEIFTEFTPKLANTTYGSAEYKGFLKEMNKALKHHYENYRHHPEHFANGINDMNLIDIIEMICDWKAASLRHNDGDIRKSIEINAERFGYGEQLKQILLNTAELLK